MMQDTILTKYDESVRQLTEVANKLTASIETGNKEKARALLEDLLNARPKVDISVTVPHDTNLQRKQENEFSVRVHVEDREAAGGVFIMKVRSRDTIFDLKKRFLLQYNLPIEVQRWIIERKIRHDTCTLHSCGVKSAGATLYLYIVTAHSVGLTPEAFEANKQAYAEGRFPMPMNPQLSTSSDGSLLASTMTTYMGKPSSPLLDRHFSPDNTNDDEKSNALMESSWTKQESNDVDAVLLDSFKPSNVSPGVIPKSTSPMATIQSVDSGIGSAYSPENSCQIPSQSLVAGNAPKNLPEPEEPERTGWNCPTCTYLNLPTRPGCAMCSTSRPESYEIPPDYIMTREELIRKAVDEEMEKRTREPGALGLTYDQKQDNLLLQLTQEGIDPQQFPFLEVDEEGFQILPQSILHEQSFNSIPATPDIMVPQGQTQMQGLSLESSDEINVLDFEKEDENSSGSSSKAELQR